MRLNTAVVRKFNRNNISKRCLFGETASIVQTGLHALQTYTGLPWWATLGASTVFVRLSLFPLVREQTKASRTLVKAIPDILKLNIFMKERLQEKAKLSEIISLVKTWWKGAISACTYHSVQRYRMVAFPLVNMSIFMTFIFSIRKMIIERGTEYGLNTGGMLWFTDLTMPDPLFAILPITSIGLTYISLEFSFQRVQGHMLAWKDLLQVMTICSFPLFSYFPAGVFCYWIPSTSILIAQSLLLKNPKFLDLIGVPLVKPAAVGKGTYIFESIENASKLIRPTESQRIRKALESNNQSIDTSNNEVTTTDKQNVESSNTESSIAANVADSRVSAKDNVEDTRTKSSV